MTRKELWEGLRVNEGRFRQALEEGVDELWRKEGTKGAGGGFHYLLHTEEFS